MLTNQINISFLQVEHGTGNSGTDLPRKLIFIGREEAVIEFIFVNYSMPDLTPHDSLQSS